VRTTGVVRAPGPLAPPAVSTLALVAGGGHRSGLRLPSSFRYVSCDVPAGLRGVGAGRPPRECPRICVGMTELEGHAHYEGVAEQRRGEGAARRR
jgi:hypothetical protein